MALVFSHIEDSDEVPSKQGPATAECTEPDSDSVHSDNESLDLDRPGTPRPLDDALVVSPSADSDSVHSDNENLDLDRPGTPRPFLMMP